MKQNTKRALLLLYRPQNQPKALADVDDILGVLPDMQPGGRRALLHWWQHQGWVEVTSLDKHRYLSLTNQGQRELEVEMDFFRVKADWRGDWQLVILRQAPPKDPHFHLLRGLLKRQAAVTVNRGVYAVVDPLLAEVHQYQAKYRHSLALFKVPSVNAELLNDLAVTQFSLLDQLGSYSGISKEVDRLLMTYGSEKGLIHQYKNQVYSLYNRFFASFCEDSGISQLLVPDSQLIMPLLARLQSLLVGKNALAR